MPNILQRTMMGIQAGINAARRPVFDADALRRQLDTIATAPVVEKALEPKDRKSFLDIRSPDTDLAYLSAYNFIRQFSGQDLPEHGSIERDIMLSKVWISEPILAGAVYSMSAKMTALSWKMTGRRNLAMYYARLYSRAAYMGGYGWAGFQSGTSTDFYTVDRGVFWETPREGSPLTGRIADIGHIDALMCTLTGGTQYPMQYSSNVTGQIRRFKHGEFAHFASMPSPREELLGIGLCAVSRAYKAAKLLIGLHKYDSEKLSNLPPEGVAAVTGLTMEEFKDALFLWQAERKKNNSLTFPQVLWLIGSQPSTNVKIDFVGFSQMPEQFDRSTVIEQYVNTLALDFGVDSREFWPISTSTLGTAAESEIQHMKAKGKGPGEYISSTERLLNHEMEDGVEFAYDTQDIEEDKIAAEVAKGWVDAYFPLTTAGGATEEMLTKDQFMRLLADRGVLPEWLLNDGRVAVEDADVHERKELPQDEAVCIEWKGGLLRPIRMPAYVINRAQTVNIVDLPETVVPKKAPTLAEPLNGRVKQLTFPFIEEYKEDDPSRNIRGAPIPEGEALRGSAVTAKAVQMELELWRKDPLLSQYAPHTPEEDAKVISNVNS